ncbi:MAG: zinc ribbon domain-containing protein [Ferrimicrobium sp.]
MTPSLLRDGCGTFPGLGALLGSQLATVHLPRADLIFVCQSCRYQSNADANAAKNIVSTAVGHMVQGRPGTSHANKHSDPAKCQLPKAA